MSQRYYVAQYNVRSFTDPDKIYKVSERSDGGWECACPNWIFNRKKHPPGWGCKHIEFIRQNRNLDEDREQFRETEERIEVEMNGRIKGFIDSLKSQ